jgi:ABC-type lipoprotein release transport system permease subunit
MLIFLVGALLGVLLGGALCVRYLRREIADDIGPKLKRVQLQLDYIETLISRDPPG